MKAYSLAFIRTEVIFDIETLLGQVKNWKVLVGSETNSLEIPRDLKIGRNGEPTPNRSEP